jgi:hypothetical protein
MRLGVYQGIYRSYNIATKVLTYCHLLRGKYNSRTARWTHTISLSLSIPLVLKQFVGKLLYLNYFDVAFLYVYKQAHIFLKIYIMQILHIVKQVLHIHYRLISSWYIEVHYLSNSYVVFSNHSPNLCPHNVCITPVTTTKKYSLSLSNISLKYAD